MNAATSVLIRVGAAFAIALAGGALSAMLARTHKQLCALISLGAGTLLGVAACGMAPECLGALHGWQFLLAAGSGYLLFALISKYIFHVCPACAASHFDEVLTHRFSQIALAMMLATGQPRQHHTQRRQCPGLLLGEPRRGTKLQSPQKPVFEGPPRCRQCDRQHL